MFFKLLSYWWRTQAIITNHLPLLGQGAYLENIPRILHWKIFLPALLQILPVNLQIANLAIVKILV